VRLSFPPGTSSRAVRAVRVVPLASAFVVSGLAGCAAHRSRPALATVPTAVVSDSARLAAGPLGGALGIPPFTVSDLAADSALTPLSFALADLLTTDLARSRRVTLVERARLGEVLRELGLASAGNVDSNTAPRVGRLLQARHLVVGQVSALSRGRDIRLGVRLADVESGVMESAVDASAPLADVLAAEKALAFRLFDRLGVSLSPDERAAIEQRPTANIAALLAYGRGVRLQFVGDYRGAAAEFRKAMRLDPKFAAARSRAALARGLAESGATNPIMVPGVRAIDAAVGVTIDRLNRPLDFITTLTGGGSTRTTDPTFASTTATVVITVNRP
jgi:hypothetical protein